MPTTTPPDAWYREVLRSRSWLPDDPEVDRLAAVLAGSDPAVDATGAATRALFDSVAAGWERGWQPADVVHLVRRDTRSRGARLATALITGEARLSGAPRRAPAAWLEQLRDLGALTGDSPGGVAAWHRAEARPAAEAWRAVLLVASVLRSLPTVDRLLPPPSRWGVGAGRPAGAPDRSGPTADARLLRRIRGLLAKAESTEFPDEAEALTAKAQELMSRHAVDTALLAAGPGTAQPVAVGTRRVHVEDPYVRAKMQLLGAVAEANGVRLVWYQRLGIANLVGVPSDVDAVELLFTSLLLQVGQALGAAERSAGRRSAARSFRRAFLLGYAGRIGERLRTARERATTAAAADAAERAVDLLPVLRSRQVAVDDAFTELFPRVRSSRVRSATDASGWYAGRAAAESADVGSRSAPLR